MFVEHGYDRSKFQKIADDFKQKMNRTGDEETDMQEDENAPVVMLPWMPIIGPKLRTAFKKHDVKVIYSLQART